MRALYRPLMIDPNRRRRVTPDKAADAEAFRLRYEAKKHVSHAGGRTALSTSEALSRGSTLSRPAALKRFAGAAMFILNLPALGRGQWQGVAKTATIMACLTVGTAALSGCSTPMNCSVTYRGGCVPNPDGPPAMSPAVTAPAVTGPAAIVSPAATSPAASNLGDPKDFADVDDKQCRSYGLAFGTRDYADCRLRLSAQHRGLDPNIGTAPR